MQIIDKKNGLTREKFELFKKHNDYLCLPSKKKSYPQAVAKLSTGRLSIAKSLMFLTRFLVVTQNATTTGIVYTFLSLN